MRSMKLATLMLGAALLTGIGATPLLAGMGDKCGASSAPAKCGGEKKTVAKCGDANKSVAKCGGEKKAVTKCSGESKSTGKGKCGAGKCGS